MSVWPVFFFPSHQPGDPSMPGTPTPRGECRPRYRSPRHRSRTPCLPGAPGRLSWWGPAERTVELVFGVTGLQQDRQQPWGFGRLGRRENPQRTVCLRHPSLIWFNMFNLSSYCELPHKSRSAVFRLIQVMEIHPSRSQDLPQSKQTCLQSAHPSVVP